MKSIEPPSTFDKLLNPSVNYVDTKARVKFNWDHLKQEKALFDHRKIVNIDIVYEIDRNRNISSYSMLQNCLFGAVRLKKTCWYRLVQIFWVGIGFDRKGCFSVIYKYSGSCNYFTDPYSNLCIPDIIKNMNIKEFNLMSRTN